MTTSAAPSTSTKEDRARADPTDDGKTTGPAVAGHGPSSEDAGTRSGHPRTQFPGTTLVADRSTMDLAREPAAGAETESRQARGTGLRGGHCLSRRTVSGQDGVARPAPRCHLASQPLNH